MRSLAAKGVQDVRSTPREEITRPAAPQRDEKEIARKKANRHKEALRRESKENRRRRKEARMKRELERTLRKRATTMQ